MEGNTIKTTKIIASTCLQFKGRISSLFKIKAIKLCQ